MIPPVQRLGDDAMYNLPVAIAFEEAREQFVVVVEVPLRVPREDGHPLQCVLPPRPDRRRTADNRESRSAAGRGDSQSQT